MGPKSSKASRDARRTRRWWSVTQAVSAQALLSLRAILSAVVIAVGSGCDPAANVEGDLQQVLGHAETSPQPAGVSERDPDTEDPSFSLPTAHAVLRADAVLRAGDGATPPDGSPSSRIRDAEAVRDLLRRAEAATSRAGIARPEIDDFSAWSVAQRTSARIDAETTLMELARSFEAAAIEESLERLVRSRASLNELAVDLRASSATPAAVPLQPLAMIPLPPPPILERAIEGLQIRERRLKELATLGADVQISAQLNYLSKWIADLINTRDSPERKEFSTDRSQLFKSIGKKQWDAQTSGRADRIEARIKLLTRELEVETGYREIAIAAHGIRGPPDTVAELVRVSLRSYDLDSTGWIRNEAHLRGLASELRSQGAIVEAAAAGPPSDYRSLTSILNDTALEHLDELATRITEPTFSVSKDLFLEKRAHQKEWAAALRMEIDRRASGGATASTDSRPIVESLVAKYGTTTGPIPSAQAEAEFVRWADFRFPQVETMPKGLRQQVADVLGNSLARNVDQADALFRRYRDLGKQMARSTSPVPDAIIVGYRNARTSLQAVSLELADSFAQAGRFGARTEMVESKLKPLLALATAGASQTPTPVGSATRPTVDSPRLLGGLRDASAHLEAVSAAAAEIDVAPVHFAENLGRLSIKEELLRPGAELSTYATLDKSQTRLTTQWVGRVNKEGQPFAFAEVKTPTRFEAIGGGIHYGEIAANKSPIDLRTSVLTFEPKKGLVIRNDATGEQWVVSSDIDPVSLKALYRFVLDGRNAAISIGWASTRKSLTETLKSEGTSEVLLDPYLVDTAVGQNLILADLIPWRLDSPTLPNGNSIPFHAAFKRLRDGYSKPARQNLERYVAEVLAAAPMERSECLAAMEKAVDPLSNLIRTVWTYDNLDATAYQSFVALEKKSFLSDAQSSEGMVKLREAVEASLKKDPASRKQWNSYTDKQKAEVLHRIAAESVQKAAPQIEADCEKRWKQLPAHLDQARMLLLELIVISTMSDPDAANRGAVDCWTAMQSARGRHSAEITDALLAFANPVTLATLFDTKIEFTFSGDFVKFQTTMNYFYGTSFIDATIQHVGSSHAPDDSEIEVRALSDMTDLVNSNEALLFSAYPPLKRVRHYAEIAAFLRWAASAEEQGLLGLVDLGELGLFPANDRDHYPTVDALQRS